MGVAGANPKRRGPRWSLIARGYYGRLGRKETAAFLGKALRNGKGLAQDHVKKNIWGFWPIALRLSRLLDSAVPMACANERFDTRPNCPKCPRELIHVTSVESVPKGGLDTHFYRCPTHGGWKVLPFGRIVPYTH